MYYPPLLNDESLYSLIARLSKINDISAHEMEEILSKTPKGWVADLTFDAELFAQFTLDTYGNIDALLGRFNSNLNHSPGKTINLSLIAHSNYRRNIWRWCHRCAIEELGKFGVAYWHNQHQRPTVLACIRHLCALREINLPFRDRQRRFLLSTDAEHLQHNSACNDDGLPLALTIAKIDEKLSNQSVELIPYAVNATFEMPQNTSFDENTFNDIIKLLWRGSPQEQSFLRKFIIHEKLPRYFLPAKIYLMHGTFERFLGQYYWAEVMLDKPISDLRQDIKTSKINHRELCTKFLMTNPSASRTDFWKAHPKSARWLSKYDGNWFKANFPLQYGLQQHQLTLI